MRKAMRTIIASLLMLVLLLGLAGCQEQEDAAPNPAEADIPEISIENITLSGKNTVLEEIQQAVNAITVPAIGCRVRIVDCPIAEHEDLMKRVQAGIVQVDLVETGLTSSLSALVSNGLLAPLDELLDTYGQELKTKEERFLPAARIHGTLYTIPANLYCGRADGIGYNAAIAQAYGIDMSGSMNLERLTQIGRTLQTEGSGIYLTTQGDGTLSAFTSFYGTEVFGGDFAYGGILYPADDVLPDLAPEIDSPAAEEADSLQHRRITVIDLYETEEYRHYCKTLQLWRIEGLMPSDSLLSGRNGQEMFNHGEIFFQYSSVSPGTKIMSKRKQLDFVEEYIAITPNRLRTELVQEFAWGITVSCAYPEKAMALLNLLYTNAELSNLLQFGREGAEYEKKGEHVIHILSEEEGGTGYSTYFSVYGDSTLQYRCETDVEITQEDIIQNTAQSQILPTFGYVFDSAPVMNEITNVRQVTDEYRPVLETGMADDVDALLDEFIANLKTAGIDRIIEENQRQLDAWVESHD